MKFKMIIDKTKEESTVVTIHERTSLVDRIENLILHDSNQECIMAYSEENMEYIPFSVVECIYVCDRKLWLVDSQKKTLRIKATLSEVEKICPEYFIRINKSAIANEKRIQKFCTTMSGAVDVVFKCGYRDYVSRRCFVEIKRRFGIK